MRVKAKTERTPYPIWVEGEYITIPPKRPVDGAIRPVGHYIDKGGYPGANVYEINIETICRETGETDRQDKPIFTNDILLWETEEEISYFIIEDQGQAVDIVSGEVLELRELPKENIKIAGNQIDFKDFIEGIQYHTQNDLPMPYLPFINVQVTTMPYLILKCSKCGAKTLSCTYKAHCTKCGGFVTAGYTTEVKREKEKVLA